MNGVPVIDLTGDGAADALGRAFRETGFACVMGHDVPGDLTDATFAAAATFFAFDDAAKEPLSIARNPHNRGWAATGSERLDPGSGQTDRKQAFNVGLDLAPDDPRIRAGEPFRGVNVWPDLVGFRATVMAYYDACLALGLRIMALVARDLGLPPDHFAQHFAAPLATLRMLSYPAATGASGEIGAGAHTDYGAITLLATDGAPGLQVHPRGAGWTDVPHMPGGYVVNIGDALARWSNGTYVSTPHRVLPPPRPRQSLAFFLDPDPDALLAPLPGTGDSDASPVTMAAHLRERLDATYGARP